MLLVVDSSSKKRSLWHQSDDHDAVVNMTDALRNNESEQYKFFVKNLSQNLPP